MVLHRLSKASGKPTTALDAFRVTASVSVFTAYSLTSNQSQQVGVHPFVRFRCGE
jgi:hypothetical protein